jgi:hypothetical protein
MTTDSAEACAVFNRMPVADHALNRWSNDDCRRVRDYPLLGMLFA